MNIKTTSKDFTIEIKQTVRFGKPVIEGTRVAVEDILRLFEAGYSIEEIPLQFPGLEVEKVKNALAFVANTLANEEVYNIECKR